MKPPDGPFQRGRIYSGGNIKRIPGARARPAAIACCSSATTSTATCCARASRRTGARRWCCKSWSTRSRCTTVCAPELSRLDRLDAELIHLDSEINERQSGDAHAAEAGATESAGRRRRRRRKRAVKDAIEKLRADAARASAQHRTLESEIDDAFNPYWGPLFREGYEVSKFGEQVEAYACVYTSRVSNFRFYSPMQYFRGPRDRMPHER